MIWRPKLDNEAAMRVSLAREDYASGLFFKLEVKQTLTGLKIKKLNGAGQNVDILVGLTGGATAALANLNDEKRWMGHNQGTCALNNTRTSHVSLDLEFWP